MKKDAGRVVIGLSGGVDSTAAVVRLQADGFEVVGLTLRLKDCASTDTERRSCCGPDTAGVAAQAAAQLGIRHYVLDCVEMFDREVLRPCWDFFAKGYTPNPCVWCNARVRFPRMLEFAGDIGAQYIATGHYARLEREGGAPGLLRGVDAGKDQSYFLHALDRELLKAVLFPMGGVLKSGLRDELRELGMVNAERAESQDICMANEEGSFSELLRVRFGAEALPGVIRTREGRTLGEHRGIHYFTIGQRRGLGVAAGRPVRVCEINPVSGEVVVSDDPADVLMTECRAVDFRWLMEVPEPGSRFAAQVRYRQKAVPCEVVQVAEEGKGVAVQFAEPVSAPTPGQFLVLYDGEKVAGGGVIT